jgi:type II secretory pathway pseudopilin PulG
VSGKNIQYPTRDGWRHKGFLMTEIIIALSLLGLLLAGLALSLNGIARFNRYQLVRQQCIAAAQAQLDSITVTGEPIGEEDFQRLWPKLNVAVKRSPGTGQWQTMELIEATASGKSYHRKVEIHLSRYIRAEGM